MCNNNKRTPNNTKSVYIVIVPSSMYVPYFVKVFTNLKKAEQQKEKYKNQSNLAYIVKRHINI